MPDGEQLHPSPSSQVSIGSEGTDVKAQRYSADMANSVQWRGAAFAVLLTIAMAAAACVPAPSPGPSVRPQPPGRGIDEATVVAPSAGCHGPAALPAGDQTLQVPVGAGTRAALASIPAAATQGEAVPVLVSLHPFSVTADGWEQYSGLAEAAAARGYLVLSPFGSQPGPRWAVPGGLDTGVDDIGFISALLDTVEDSVCVDRNREFAAGFSAGAAMSQALSCTLPWRFAAIAGSGGANLTSLCPDSPPTDTMILHGTADPIAPPTGSEVAFAPPQGLSILDVVATNAARAGCATAPVTDQVAAHVVVDRYQGCGDHRVEFWSLVGAGHTWAGTESSLLEIVTGPTNTEISANTEVLDFFDAS